MFIKKIKGNFGKLCDETLQFSNGLNVITRSNEWGKTTAVALIKTMFYGLNTSKRDRKDQLSDKTKYVSSGEYEGEMLISKSSRDISITRSVTGKSEVFNAFFVDDYSKTGYGPNDIGKSLLGVTEEAFSNSALIESENRLISNSDELYDLIIALSTTGDSDLNYKSAMKYIKNLKSNVSKNFHIPTLESEVSSLKIDLSKREMYESEVLKLQDGVTQYKQVLQQKRSSAVDVLNQNARQKYEKETRKQIVKDEADNVVLRLQSECKPQDLILNAKTAYEEFCSADELEYRLRIEISEKRQHIENKIAELNNNKSKPVSKSPKFKINVMPLMCSLCFAILSACTLYIEVDIPFLGYALALISVICLIFTFGSDKSDEFESFEKYEKVLNILKNELNLLAKNHKNYVENKSVKFNKMIICGQKLGGNTISTKDDVYNQIVHSLDVLERYNQALEFQKNAEFDVISEEGTHHTNNEEIAKIEAEFLFTEKQLEILTRELVRCESTLESMPSLDEIKQSIKDKQELIFATDDKIKSIQITEDALTQANESLTSRLSPQICKKASEYLAEITSSRYDDVILRNDFEALCKLSDGYQHLDKLRLSSGSKDQLYFALRLAICDILLPKDTPLILDDPFVFYDDERTIRTMRLLKKLANTRQILLFTCRSREQEILPLL